MPHHWPLCLRTSGYDVHYPRFNCTNYEAHHYGTAGWRNNRNCAIREWRNIGNCRFQKIKNGAELEWRIIRVTTVLSSFSLVLWTCQVGEHMLQHPKDTKHDIICLHLSGLLVTFSGNCTTRISMNAKYDYVDTSEESEIKDNLLHAARSGSPHNSSARN